MNRKAESALLMSNVVYLIIVVLFLIGVYAFMFQQREGAGVWEDYYSKEISKIVNLASGEEKVVLNVHKGTVIAKRNGISDFNDIFKFNNEKKEICVQLNINKKTCYYYFNDVEIRDVKIELGVPENLIHFRIISNEGKNG